MYTQSRSPARDACVTKRPSPAAAISDGRTSSAVLASSGGGVAAGGEISGGVLTGAEVVMHARGLGMLAASRCTYAQERAAAAFASMC